ncbi:MAG: hypothetical protein AB1295_03710 [Candidatus Micrarchaeota archaeon]
MGDVRKDVEDMVKMKATGADSLRIMASLTATVIRSFYRRKKNENPAASMHQHLKKMDEDIFHGRRDNR